MANVEDLRDLAEAQPVIALHKKHSIATSGVDCCEARSEILSRHTLAVDAEYNRSAGGFLQLQDYRVTLGFRTAGRSGHCRKLTRLGMEGTITRKIISRTSRTSIIGVTLISELIPAGFPLVIAMAKLPLFPLIEISWIELSDRTWIERGSNNCAASKTRGTDLNY